LYCINVFLMRSAIICPVYTKPILIILLFFIAVSSRSQSNPLINAFAHNDYFHKFPLQDALDNGFTQVEADIYLRKGKLIVAHILPMLSKRTLESLYLKPLEDYVNGKGKSPFGYPMMLMIDIKSDADKTYDQLELELEKYKPMLTCYENGVFIQKQVTIVLSGHKPTKKLEAQQNRIVFLDENLMRIKQDTLTKSIFQMASCKYSNLLKWNGKGMLPEEQRQRLCEYVNLAHKQGEKVRLWSSPEKTIVWKELLSCGVDLINTDKLAQLKNFLVKDAKNTPK
jgi:hypothetical protein